MTKYLFLFTIILILGAVALFFARFTYTLKIRKIQGKNIRHRWLVWYDNSNIVGTSSSWYRDYMSHSNKLTAAMWLLLLVAIIILTVLSYF